MAPVTRNTDCRIHAGFRLMAAACADTGDSGCSQAQSGQSSDLQPPANSQPAQDIPDAPSTVQPPAPKPADAPPETSKSNPATRLSRARPAQQAGSDRITLRRPCPRLRPFPQAAGRGIRSIPRKISTPFRFRPTWYRFLSWSKTPTGAPSMGCFPKISPSGKRQETDADLLHQRSFSAFGGGAARHRHRGRSPPEGKSDLRIPGRGLQPLR